MYPGCPFEREVLGLELVQLVLSELVPVDGTNGTDQRERPLAKVRACVSFMDSLYTSKYGRSTVGFFFWFAWRSGRFVESTTSVC